MFGFISTKRHREAITALESNNAALSHRVAVARQTVNAHENTIARLVREKSALQSELAPLRAAREKQLAALKAANDRRKANARRA